MLSSINMTIDNNNNAMRERLICAICVSRCAIGRSLVSVIMAQQSTDDVH